MASIGENAYNQGRVGGQPEYGSPYNTGRIGDQEVYRKKDGRGHRPNSNNHGRVGDRKPYPGMPPGGYGRAPGSLDAQGPGSKPMALHSEYAMGEGSDSKSYGSQDVIFYILRCDGDRPSDLPEDPEPNYVWSESQGGMVPIEPGGSSGPNADSGSVQSGANQIAAGRSVQELGEPQGGPMAPMSGFDIEESEPLGSWSQNAAFDVDVTTAVRNALRTVPGLGSDVVVKGLASSERMFNRMLLNGFVPLNELQQTRTERQILDTFDRPTTTDLAFLLARETDGITKMEDVVKAINNGEIGAVSSKSRAHQERISPYTRRRR